MSAWMGREREPTEMGNEHRIEVHLHHNQQDDSWGVALVGDAAFDAWESLEKPIRFGLSKTAAESLLEQIEKAIVAAILGDEE